MIAVILLSTERGVVALSNKRKRKCSKHENHHHLLFQARHWHDGEHGDATILRADFVFVVPVDVHTTLHGDGILWDVPVPCDLGDVAYSHRSATGGRRKGLGQRLGLIDSIEWLLSVSADEMFRAAMMIQLDYFKTRL